MKIETTKHTRLTAAITSKNPANGQAKNEISPIRSPVFGSLPLSVNHFRRLTARTIWVIIPPTRKIQNISPGTYRIMPSVSGFVVLTIGISSMLTDTSRKQATEIISHIMSTFFRFIYLAVLSERSVPRTDIYSFILPCKVQFVNEKWGLLIIWVELAN